MSKIKITADAVLSIIQGIFSDEDVNVVIDDPSAPPSWAGKTIEQILNVEYYTFKHRPISTQNVIDKMLEENGQTDKLAGISRAFCLLSLGNIERLFSKDVDMVVLSASLEYYIQTSKVKLLEYLIEDCNIATSGLRIPVQFGNETRKAVIIFGQPTVSDIQTAATFGEMALVDVAVNLILYPDVISYSEYTVSVSFRDSEGELKTSTIPLSSFTFVNTMTQKAVPRATDTRRVGNVNLSNAKSFVLVFEGYNNDFINHITDKALSSDASQDNNESFILSITRGDAEAYTHEVVIKDHQVIVNADTGNETHTLTLVTGGVS
jgi:hypothetical protein